MCPFGFVVQLICADAVFICFVCVFFWVGAAVQLPEQRIRVDLSSYI